jgi:hypothetical protein
MEETVELVFLAALLALQYLELAVVVVVLMVLVELVVVEPQAICPLPLVQQTQAAEALADRPTAVLLVRVAQES